MADGGCSGWLVVLGSHVCCMFVFGVYQSIGPMFVALQGYFGASSATTSWILSLTLFLQMCLGPLANMCVKKIGYRATIMTGTLISSIGFFSSSFAPSINVLYLTYGVFVGVGYSLIMSPALGIIPLFVKKKYGLANAAAVSGAATGTFIFTPLNQLLLETYGWRGTLIVFSAINANMFISGALFRTHVTINTSRNKEDNVKNCDSKNTIDETSGSQSSCCFPLTRVVTAFGLKVFCNVPTFGLLCICKFFGVGLGFVSTPAYVVLYTANIKLASPERLALLVSIFAAGSIIGRLSPPAILYVSCSCLNSTRLFGISLLLAGISTLLSPFLATSYGSYSVYTALLGIFSGIFLTLMSHVIKDSTGGLNVTAGFGFSAIFLGFGALIGPTLGGFIYDKTGDYKNSFYFYGSCMTFAGLLMLILEPCSRNAIKKSSITTNVLTTVSSTRNLIDIATQTGREDGAM